MKLAFASCMSYAVFAQQPVWDQIAAQHPDRLLLLGDSVYLDGPPFPNNIHPRELENNDFLLHVLKRWQVQLDQPQFRALVKQPALHLNCSKPPVRIIFSNLKMLPVNFWQK